MCCGGTDPAPKANWNDVLDAIAVATQKFFNNVLLALWRRSGGNQLEHGVAASERKPGEVRPRDQSSDCASIAACICNNCGGCMGPDCVQLIYDECMGNDLEVLRRSKTDDDLPVSESKIGDQPSPIVLCSEQSGMFGPNADLDLLNCINDALYGLFNQGRATPVNKRPVCTDHAEVCGVLAAFQCALNYGPTVVVGKGKDQKPIAIPTPYYQSFLAVTATRYFKMIGSTHNG
jgi:hypothetical protein